MSESGVTSLRLHRTFSAPREQVFRAWTEAKALEQWFRPNGMRTHVMQLDLRVGGGYHFDLFDSEGRHTSISGTYIAIERPVRLVFTWVSAGTEAKETLVTVEFLEHASVTEVVLTHERFADAQMVKNHEYGWESCVDQIATVLA